jgi:hypothetical protein
LEPSRYKWFSGGTSIKGDPIFGLPMSEAERRFWRSMELAGTHRARFRRPGSFGNQQTLSGPGASVNSSEVLSDGLTTGEGSRFPWLYPTADFQNLDKYGIVALPAATTTATIGGPPGTPNAASSMPWTVPQGFNGFLKTMGIEFVVNGSSNLWTPGIPPAAPTLIFSLIVNGFTATDYANIVDSPGTIASPTAMAGIPIKEGNVVQINVKNVSIPADTQYVKARLQGYYYGKHFEPPDMAQ